MTSAPPTRAKFRDVQPVLPVRDLAAALAFYTERLGFRFLFGDRSGAPAYAGVGRDGVEIHLQWQSEADIGGTATGLGNLRFLVDDPDALFREFSALHALPAGKTVRDTDWGTREFGFFDPDGNGLTFYRPR
jgi:catechol 2,3-dioxygenase-like lactoylglutathione lyase family enzyme